MARTGSPRRVTATAPGSSARRSGKEVSSCLAWVIGRCLCILMSLLVYRALYVSSVDLSRVAEVLLGEGDQRRLEDLQGRTDQPGADLADAGLAVGDAGVDARRDPELHHLPQIDPHRRAAEAEGGDGEERMLG